MTCKCGGGKSSFLLRAEIKNRLKLIFTGKEKNGGQDQRYNLIISDMLVAKIKNAEKTNKITKRNSKYNNYCRTLRVRVETNALSLNFPRYASFFILQKSRLSKSVKSICQVGS
jgi:hypothetical protein